MTDVTAESIYQTIKGYEGQFTPPAPYFTIDVGTFNVDASTFAGLTSTRFTDPEPVEHQPGQHPVNRPGSFVGNTWVEVEIDPTWHRTTTRIPAPKVGLVPVLLRFTVSRLVPAGWSVTVNGSTVTAGPADTQVTANIWDAASASWTIDAAGLSYADSLLIQRKGDPLGAAMGAFTIPVLPASVIYAPPAASDGFGQSVATYGQGQTLGSSASVDSSQESSSTVPLTGTQYDEAGAFGVWLTAASSQLSDSASAASKALGANPSAADAAAIANANAAASAFSVVAGQLGKFSSTITQDTSADDLTQITCTMTTTESTSTTAAAGGPGTGDVLVFFKNLTMIWAYAGGEFHLSPIDAVTARYPVGAIMAHLADLGLSAGDVQSALALDPFVAGGPDAALPAGRFVYRETDDYGYGTSITVTQTHTRDTKDTTTDAQFTSVTQEWDAGPILSDILGLGGKDTTTVKLANATGTDVSTTVSLSGTLYAGVNDNFSVAIWYDSLFGTFAFQQLLPTATPRLTGTGEPGQVVTLEAAGRTYRTAVGADGKYAFHAPTIPAGAALVSMASATATPVSIEPAD